MASNEYKDNDNISRGKENVTLTAHNNQIYNRRYDNNHHRSSATEFFGETPEIGKVLCLLLEKQEKE